MDILFDVLKSQKNVLVARNFHNFDKHDLSGGKVRSRGCVMLLLFTVKGDVSETIAKCFKQIRITEFAVIETGHVHYIIQNNI